MGPVRPAPLIGLAAVPFVEPSLFRNRRYSLGLTIAFLMAAIGYSLSFLSPLLLANVNHLGTGFIGFVMAPAAVAQALLSRKGGRLADAKGNPFLFYVASALLLTCFVSLSSVAGGSPVMFSGVLTFGNVGLAFMQISMSNTISQTLPNDQTGVGMGLLSMLNFIAGALAAGIYGKVIDLNTTLGWNPLNMYPDAFVYSNTYFTLALLSACTLLIYHFQFGRAVQKSRQAITHDHA